MHDPTTTDPEPDEGVPTVGVPTVEDTEGHRFVPVDERPPIGSPGPGPSGSAR